MRASGLDLDEEAGYPRAIVSELGKTGSGPLDIVVRDRLPAGRANSRQSTRCGRIRSAGQHIRQAP